MLSGIGPRQELEKHGVEVVVDNPNVGENLQDHMIVGLGYTSKLPTIDGSAGSLSNIYRYLTKKEGPLASTCIEAMAFVQTGVRNDLKEAPDLQIHFLPITTNPKDDENFGIKKEFRNGYDPKTHGMILIPTLLHPKSTGTIKLKDKNPFSHPKIQPNYLKERDDMRTMVEGLKLCKKIAETKAFAEAVGTPMVNKAMEEVMLKAGEKESDAYWEQMVRYFACTVFHPVGTCAMGSEDSKSAVCNPNLEVLGVKRLRVCDASIMPTLPSGNTNAPSIMVGEKGADLIKIARRKQKAKGTDEDL